MFVVDVLASSFLVEIIFLDDVINSIISLDACICDAEPEVTKPSIDILKLNALMHYSPYS